jgi:hypothetical protein
MKDSTIQMGKSMMRSMNTAHFFKAEWQGKALPAATAITRIAENPRKKETTFAYSVITAVMTTRNTPYIQHQAKVASV